MTMVKISNLKKTFNELEILKDIHLLIKNGEKIGLVGKNGAGKTTLCDILRGNISYDSGIIHFPKSIKIGYLSQSSSYELKNFNSSSDKSFYEFAKKLGLSHVKENHALSGGERLKLALASVWSDEPDLLILDEPTNHLDYHGITELIFQIKNFKGSVLIISHDRYFLDETVSRICELDDGKINEYNGNYSYYREEKKRRFNEQMHHYDVQQNKKKEIEKQITQLKNWADKAHRTAGKSGSLSENRQIGLREFERVKAKKLDNQVKSKQKRLEAELEKHKIDKPNEELSISFSLESSLKSGKRIIEANQIAKKFGNKTLFHNSHFYITSGERIGIFGSNGVGKSTLINILLEKDTVSEGSLWISPSAKIAYLAQDMNGFNEDKTILETLDLHDSSEIEKSKNMLINMGFSRSSFSQKLSEMSYGEKMKIKFLNIMLHEYNVIVLDEPTNHLDLHYREMLEETLSHFTGTIIVVSHDRYFLNLICDKLLVFENGKINRIEKKLNEFLEKKTDTNNDLMVIENRLQEILGKLSFLSPSDKEYEILDNEFKTLLKKKKEMK